MSAPRLSLATLSGLPAPIARPEYDIAGVDIGILHLGLGAFHRAHQAVYTDDAPAPAIRAGASAACACKTPRAIDRARAAGRPVHGAREGRRRRHGARDRRVREALFLGADASGVIARFADPRIQVVTLTVTEKGYCHDPATGRLDFAHPDIVHDLAHPESPGSAVGMLVAGLAARRAAARRSAHRRLLRQPAAQRRTVEGIVAAFAQARDPALADWIGAHVAFPVHDGRPHRACDDRRRRRRGRARCSASPTRRRWWPSRSGSG